jgi:branched-chain amino acid transport system substrate-binding protein
MALLILTAACSEHASGAPPASPLRNATLGVLAPLSGSDAQLGLGTLNSVQQAVDEANASDFVHGWKLTVEAFDDQGDQSVGQQVATRFVSDPSVIGVVGGLRSSVDEGVQPIFAEAGLAQISPGSVDPELTQREVNGVMMRPFASYMRVAPNLNYEGQAGARFIVDRLRSTRVAVVNDGRASGRAIAASAVHELQARHVTVAPVESVAPDSTPAQLATTVAHIMAAKVQTVYIAADVDVARPFIDALRASMPDVHVVGTSSLFEPTFWEAGPIDGIWATYPGATPPVTASARGFLARYAAAKHLVPAGNDGPAAYDAAWALIRAFAVLDPGTATVTPAERGLVAIGASAEVFAGATGPVAFDAFGDNTSQNFSFYQSSGVTWVPGTSVRVAVTESP